MANESGCDNALLGTSQEYYASGNLSWLEVTGLLNPGIPVNKNGVEMYRNMFGGSAPLHRHHLPSSRQAANGLPLRRRRQRA